MIKLQIAYLRWVVASGYVGLLLSSPDIWWWNDQELKKKYIGT